MHIIETEEKTGICWIPGTLLLLFIHHLEDIIQH